MTKPVVQKVLAYIVCDGRLLVFRHRDHPEAGLQIPAGTVRDGEPFDAAVLREAHEETGLSGLAITRFLGRYEVDIAPYRDEIQDRFVFQLDVADAPPAEWVHYELHDGLQSPTALCFHWLPLGDPELDELVVEQGALLAQLQSEEQPVIPTTRGLCRCRALHQLVGRLGRSRDTP